MPFNFAAALTGSPLLSSAATDNSRRQQDRRAAGLPLGFNPLPPVNRDQARNRNRLAGRTIPAAPLPMTAAEEAAIFSLEAHPSINAFADGGRNATVTVDRFSRYFAYFDERDRREIEALAEEMLTAMKHFSGGPYNKRILRRLGHPYGFGPGKTKQGRQETRRVARRAAGRSIGAVTGLRGSAPTLSVINVQSGRLRASWHKSVEWGADGFRLRFWNTARTKRGAPYPLYLLGGTGRMQSHGPWNQVPLTYLSRLDSLHRRAIHRARLRAMAAQRMAEDLAREEAHRLSVDRATGFALGEPTRLDAFGRLQERASQGDGFDGP